MQPIILPQGVAALWQHAITEDSRAQWDELASDLLHAASDTRDPTTRDDVLTLALVACELAGTVIETISEFQIALELEAA